MDVATGEIKWKETKVLLQQAEHRLARFQHTADLSCNARAFFSEGDKKYLPTSILLFGFSFGKPQRAGG